MSEMTQETFRPASRRDSMDMSGARFLSSSYYLSTDTCRASFPGFVKSAMACPPPKGLTPLAPFAQPAREWADPVMNGWATAIVTTETSVVEAAARTATYFAPPS